MSTSSLSYPHSPENAGAGTIRPSKKFKKQVISVINVITLFFITYIALVAAAVAIAVLSGIAGAYIMLARLHFITIAFGAALIGSGLMLVYFVIKFAFKRNQRDYSGMLEITEEDSPQLFEFIKKLTTETGARLPKHVYLSADVNASVFYDSTFWSMFLPVRKNLLIGLGLVNTLNQSEFKAVLAHEFGHFSQRSMKFGSYVYNLNNIIYNMLYENDDYMAIINLFAKTHIVVRFAAYINVYVVKGMQYVLRKVYVVMNKTYMGLSREMEFHADSIGASVSGCNHMISSLRRIDAAQECYNMLVNFLDTELQQKNKVSNIYPLHRELLKVYAGKHGLELDMHAVPVMSKSEADLTFLRVEINNPWASHPTNTERESHLSTLPFHAHTSTESAWALFNQAEEIQEQMTELMYTRANVNNQLEQKDVSHFINTFHEDWTSNNFNPVYKGYYDNRPITKFDPEEAAKKQVPSVYNSLQELLSFSNCTLSKRINALSQDLGNLNAIAEVKNKFKSFKFSNTTYRREDTEQVKAMLEKELEELNTSIKELDEHIFTFCYQHAASSDQQQQLVDQYKTYLEQQALTNQDLAAYQTVTDLVQATATRMPYKQIEELMGQLYEAEVQVKKRLQEILTTPVYASFITQEYGKDIQKYLSQRWNYFHHKKYDNMALNIARSALQAYACIVFELNYSMKKHLLDFQLHMIND